MIQRLLFWVLLLVLFLVLSGCMNFSIQKDMDYPEFRFKQKLAELESTVNHRRGKSEKASRMNFLLYDGGDRELVSFWIWIHLFCDNLDRADIGDHETEIRYSGGISGLNRDVLKKMDGLGPGLIAEIRDFDENSHVLIWLE